MKNVKITHLTPVALNSLHNSNELVTNELKFAWRLLSKLQGVAIIAIDENCNVSYANQYARQIFNISTALIAGGIGRLPNTIDKHISAELISQKNQFVMRYAAGDTLRTLKVFVSGHELAQEAQMTFVLHMYDISDQVATELQLRNSEAMLRSLMIASPDFICFKDENNRWLEANKNNLALYELADKDYQNKTDLELASSANPIFAEAFNHSKISEEEAWYSRKNIHKEVAFKLPDGGEKILYVTKIPLFNDDGSRQGLVSLSRDITQQKATENSLNHYSAMLDTLISCGWLLHSAEYWHSVAITFLQQLCLGFRFTRATILQNINLTYAQNTNAEESTRSKILYQWSKHGFADSGNSLEKIDFNNDALNRWKENLEQGNPVYGDICDLPFDEQKILNQSNTRSIAIVPLFSDTGWWGNILIERCENLIKTNSQELGSLLALGRSLSVAIQRELADKQLNQAKIAFDSASEGIMIIDTNACIIGINKTFTDITGYSEEEMMGYTPKILQAGNHEVWRSLLNEGRWRGEINNVRKNGETYLEWLTITVVKNQADETINYVGVFDDITEIKQSQNKLNELVNHDPLTGLPNRRLFNELLEHAIKCAEREQNKIAILFIDLDRFKAVNDNLGHQVGDQLLYQVAQRIIQSMRESDVVARLGGDEFIVMMDMIYNQDDVTLVAQKIIHAFQTEFVIEGNELFLSASIGISIFPNDGNTVEHIIKAADIAMYQVKNTGKNNYCFYSQEFIKNVSERFNIENHLRRALERNQFEVYYQPQVSLITGDIIGAEALIRWNHPDLGIVSPAKFIPLAEETGLIVAIGEWVLREAALQAIEWCKAGSTMKCISVNVSGVQVMQSNFADTVYGVIIETDCDPSMLELEITESTVMLNTEYVIDTFARIKQLGVHLAIDDFGTGYSSLSNLKRLPLDKLKIDQSFVRDLPNDLDDAAIANAIYAMARSLGFSIIAEGVETPAQAAFLKNMGCEEAQGYLYSKPVTAPEFSKLLT